MQAEEFTVFYAWQSDSPSRENRNFIESAIEAALKAIRKTGSVQASPRLDKDTRNVTGIPDIANTILEKIRAADLIVADVSFIAKVDAKLIPNPNVMIELGYALSEIGWERIVIVLNTATGTPDDLPFDLRNRRWPYLYETKPDMDDNARADAKMGLTKQLRDGIEAIAKLPPRQKQGTISERLDALETMVSTLNSSVAQSTIMSNLLSGLQKSSSASVSEPISADTKCQNKLNELIQRVSTGKFYEVCFQQGMFVLSILPTSAPTPLPLFEANTEQMLILALQPLNASGWSHRRYGERLVTTSHKETSGVDAATEITTDGCVNAASHEVIAISSQFWQFAGQQAPADTVCIPSAAFEKRVIEGVFSYLKVLKALGAKGPWYVGFGAINVKKSILYVREQYMFGGRAFDGDQMRPPILEIPGDIELVGQQFQPVARALRPAFDYIWREHNYPQSMNYAATGDWVGQ